MTVEEQKRIFGENLTRMIEESGMSQKAVAEAVGESPQNISNWCLGHSLPRVDKIQELAEYFGTVVTALIDPVPEFPDRAADPARIARLLAARRELCELILEAEDAEKEDVRSACLLLREMKQKDGRHAFTPGSDTKALRDPGPKEGSGPD